MRAGSTIAEDVLDRPVAGVNLAPGSLREQLDEGPSLLVFLRHFGCVFCREAIADLRALAESDAGFPRVVFFFEGSVREGRALLRRYWPEAHAVSDPDLFFYRAFGVTRGNLVQTLGPGVWAARRRSRGKGHLQGERTGDVWRMPGLFVVRGGRVLYAHAYGHAGEAPDYARIAREAAAG